ncbi:hypothetical protein ABW20_dc0101339 [Dactylellina cionopaga]|nr:hypothetical protein ABW20_dc0101339 [Dactylellina cionopaga]
MYFKIDSVAICTVLALIPTIVSHGLILQAYGDGDESIIGKGLGVLETTKALRGYPGKFKGQRDIPVFSNPTIPDENCKKCPRTEPFNKCAKCLCKGKNCKETFIPGCLKCTKKNNYNLNCVECRTPLPNGCGRTFYVGDQDLYDFDDPKVAKWKGTDRYGKGSLNTKAFINKLAKKNKIPLVKAGGYLTAKVLQFNADGAGPYHCKLDMTGQATQWEGTPLEVVVNVPGDGGFLNGENLKHKMVIKMPANLQCTGSYGGMERICIARCQNEAANGPFGGCIAFQQTPGSPAPSPPTPEQPIPGPETIEGDLNDDETY